MQQTGKALAVIAERASGAARRAGPRTLSAFAAQLLAVSLDQPVYRLRRRAVPEAAVAAYRAAAAIGASVQA
jgi:hypothetical protein